MDLRLAFLGTPRFAVPTLERLAEAGFDILGVWTQPDRPRGRGLEAAPSPVKETAARLNLPVHQPEKIRRPEVVESLRELRPEVMVVVGYGQIIPQSIIDISRLGIVNVHASLLPKYRGAAPVQWAIAGGETRTGVTIMRIDAGLDTGDILTMEETEIGEQETAVELAGRLAQTGADLLVRALRGLAAGEITPRPQDHAQASYAPLLKKADGLIDWRRTAFEIHNRLRGFQPWPGAFTTFRGQSLHIWRALPASGAAPGEPGGLTASHDGLRVTCGLETALDLLEVQVEGRKRVSAEAFVNGYRPKEAEKLGESAA